MNISRVVTLSLAVAVFALGYVNPASAVKPGANCDPAIPVPIHPSCAKEDPGTDPSEGCDQAPCIVSVGKSLRRAAADYAVAAGGTYTVMSPQRFGEILGTPAAIEELCDAVDVVIVEWSNPKIKNLTWPRLVDFMACDGGIIFEDPRNVEVLAPGVSTLEINFKSTDNQPITISLISVPVLTLGSPVSDIPAPPDCSTGSCNLTVVNQHMIFNLGAIGSDSILMPFLTLADGTGRVVGLYGMHPTSSGGIVLTGLDNNFHGNLFEFPDASDADNLARANMHKLLHNEINWLLGL